ncbi:MAG TPA: NADH-quinone oxidoreductase subunit L [Opitutales bacterium]|nr:NADH-quinone oxidoreductase subunit L [Opitutales bacterium]
MTRTLLFILLSPLCAAALIALFGRQRGRLSAAISVGSAGLQMALALSLLCGGWNGETFRDTMTWMTLGDLSIDMGFYFNGMSALLLMVVTVVGFFIHVFAFGYSDDDKARGRFFGGLSIFMFSMTGIVVSENLFMLFIFWELVGFSSYMLIGHYLTSEASDASKKAFIVNRVGDFGFLIGIIWCFWQFGTVSLAELPIAIAASPVAACTLTFIGLLLFCGVMGKSAQMPLHVWLPDAMAGPTPVSALIHAATMVAAGVYLLGRVAFIFSPEALSVILAVGLTTAFLAALFAFGQTDIKKILAYSTLSQLGFMVVAFALVGGAEGAATSQFHLTTHAFFKALLFLGAGSVIHACHHEQDIYRMGGLWKKMPVTFITFTLATLAIAGVPYFSGFFSKDAILLLAQHTNPAVFWLLVVTSFLTATYMGRIIFVAFLGKAKSHGVEHAHESRPDMLIALVVLAIGAVLAGYTGLYPHALASYFESNIAEPTHSEHTTMLVVSAILSLGGLLTAYLVYYRPEKNTDTFAKAAPGVYSVLRSKLWFDEFYGWYVRAVQQRMANLVSIIEQVVIQGVLVRGSGGVASLVGLAARRAHTGSINTYFYWFAAGVVAFWLFTSGVL